MERKIGEIFEHNGEWYQCIKSDSYRCDYCDYGELGNCDDIACRTDERKDGKEVYFKKLEKTGEPYYSKYLGKSYQRYKTYIPAAGNNFKIRVEPVEHVGRNEIFIEIKQNKEDMEENKLNLKPFDIQKAREGKPVCTRGGKKARIICFDRKGYNMFPIVALIMNGDRESDIYTYRPNGTWDNSGNESDKDLMMLPEKKEGWVNIVKEALSDDRVVLGRIFDSYEDAFMSGKANERYIATVKIEWTE